CRQGRSRCTLEGGLGEGRPDRGRSYGRLRLLPGALHASHGTRRAVVDMVRDGGYVAARSAEGCYGVIPEPRAPELVSLGRRGNSTAPAVLLVPDVFVCTSGRT